LVDELSVRRDAGPGIQSEVNHHIFTIHVSIC